MSRLVYGLRPVLELLRSGQPVSVIYLAAGNLPAPQRPSEPGARESTRPEASRRIPAASNPSRARSTAPAAAHAPQEQTTALGQLQAQAQRRQVAIELRSRGELDVLADGKLHQGVIAVAGEYPYREPRELLAAAGDQPALLLVLDELQDPQNLGALVRTSHGLGAHGVIVPRHRASGVTPAVVKASAGATEHMPIAMCTNIVRTLEQLKEASLWIIGTSAEAGEPPWAIDFTLPTALVLGSEGKGVRPLVLRSCDRLVRIPTAGRVASLNVAAAGAMLLYEALRQRKR